MNAPVSSFTPGTLVETSAASVSAAMPCTRLSLRARDDLAPFEAALGLSLGCWVGSTVGVEVGSVGCPTKEDNLPVSNLVRKITCIQNQ